MFIGREDELRFEVVLVAADRLISPNIDIRETR